MTLPIVAVTVLVVVIMMFILKENDGITLDRNSFNQISFPAGKFKTLQIVFVTLVIFISSALPLIQLLITSGSFAIYKKALTTSWKPLLVSVGYSTLTGIALTVISFVIACFLYRKRRITAVEAVLFLPIAIPGALMGLGMIYIWNRPSFEFHIWLFNNCCYGTIRKILCIFVQDYCLSVKAGIKGYS